MKKVPYTMIAAIMLLSACGKKNFADDILRMQSRPIDMGVCEEAVCYKDGVETSYISTNSAYKLIIYIDSLSCSPCFISHMYDYEETVEEFDSAGIRTVFIFEPQEEKVENVMSLLEQQAYPFLSVVVRNDGFSSDNPHLPSSSVLHSFLLNEKNEVMIVGNPMRNAQIKELMLNSIKQ